MENNMPELLTKKENPVTPEAQIPKTELIKLANVPTQVPKVQHTTRYDLFRVLPGNRAISKYHVREIAESFAENPNLIEIRPILVNEDMEIIDGQHRLRACEMLGIQVPYIVAPGLTIGTAQIMNALQRAWSLTDFANSHAYGGNASYQKFLRYLEDYAPIAPNALLMFITNRADGKGTKTRFKMGKFVFPDDTVDLDRRLGMLTSMADAGVTFWASEAFTSSFRAMLRTLGDEYDHERLITNIKKMSDFERKATIMEQLRELERAYNHNRTMAGIKRFF